MRIYLPLNLEPKRDLGKILSKNLLVRDKLVSPISECAILVTETNSKVREPITYNKAIDNPINDNMWRKVVDEVLWDLHIYQT